MLGGPAVAIIITQLLAFKKEAQKGGEKHQENGNIDKTVLKGPVMDG